MKDSRNEDVFDQRSYTYKEFAVLVTEKLKELDRYEKKVDDLEKTITKYEAWRIGTAWLIATIIAILGLIIAYLSIQ